jgi:hypothetical protein
MANRDCNCGCIPPHGTPDECARNRESTGAYMMGVTSSGIDGAIARGKRLSLEHDGHLRPQYGCPKCPLDGRFVRDSSDGDWYVPTATVDSAS